MENAAFISGIRSALAQGLEAGGCQVVVQGTEIQEGVFGVLYSIDFGLRGAAASKAEFSYTFHSEKPVEQNLNDLREFVESQRGTGDEPPVPVTEAGYSA